MGRKELGKKYKESKFKEKEYTVNISDEEEKAI